MSYKEGYERAKIYGLEAEYMACIADGLTPEEALEEWDLLQVDVKFFCHGYNYLCCEVQIGLSSVFNRYVV